MAFSCECNQTKGLRQEIKIRDYVLLGRILTLDSIIIVDSVELANQNKNPNVTRESNRTHFPVARYSIEVSAIYKGKFASDAIELYSLIEKSYCGLKLKVGSEYVIYANKSPEKITDHMTIFPQGEGIVWSHRCNRTREVNKEELSSLKNYFK